MNTLLHWLTSPEWALVVKALLHSLWQGAVITVALALLLRRVASPEARYRIAMAGLGAVLLSAMITWGVLNVPTQSVASVAPMPEMNIAETPAATGPVEKIVVAANWTPAKQQTQWTAWLALAWLFGASAMLGRASVKVAGAEQLRRSCQPLTDPRIADLVAEARRAVNLTRQVRIAVTNQLTSPAVVGVLVPTLILPLSLITTLTPEQIRFVLLHELAHIRRGDYLANLFQLFAEALFFFNPAVWWLSHQIRREREACCDSLAIQLSGAPADYARTLVSVAETMLNPSPAAAPAFGNEREPSSLADRVQRVLVPGYRPSLRLTWRTMLAAMALGVVMLGLLAVGARETVAATATLVSGAEKQPSTTAAWTNIPGLEPKELDQIESAIQKWLAIPVAERPSGTNVVGVLLNAQHLVQNGKLAYEAGRLDEARRLFKYALVVDSDNVAAKYYLDVMEQQERRVPAQALQLPSISVASESATFNPSEKALTARGNVEITAANGMKITTEEARIQLGTNSAAIGANTNLYTRTFKVNTNEFTRTLGLVGAVAPTNFQAAVHNFFSNLGVDLMAPGKSFFYGERSGMLLVRATLADLDIVEQALQVMNTPAPQVNIQARFVEMTQNDAKAMGFDWFMGNSSIVGTNLVHHPQSIGKFSLTSNLLTGILTPPQFKVVLRALEQREGVELLSAPDITTMSGRQAQIQVVDMKTLVTGETPLITDGMEVRLLQTTNMPFGPVLDVFPHVSTDGYSVQMTLIPSVTEFLGYDKPDATLTNFPMEKLLSADLPLPHYRLRQAVAQVNVWDGQTIVIGGLTSEIVTRQPDGSTTKNPDPKPQKKQLFVFITPTIIDPAGNRVHADEEMAGKVGAAPKSNPVFPGPLVPTEGEKIRDWPAVPSKLPKDWK